MDMTTVTAWIHVFGWKNERVDESTLRIYRESDQETPFFLRVTANWVLLKISPVLAPSASRPPDLARRLLAVNRDIRLAKFAYDEDGEVALAAELPTESLDRPELRDAIERMRRYAEHYRAYLSASPAG